ncbi:MAG: hypothetical protein KDD73_04245 [Anaerolineales bacterium]|nr:hypothetical protein [Anaerolineales bacterium]
MSQTLLYLLQAMLKGLAEELRLSDAAIVLPDSAAPLPHILVRVGTMTLEAWHALLRDQPPALMCLPLRSRSVEGRPARLCIYRPGKEEWGRASQLSVGAMAAAVDYLLDVPGDDFDWMQLVASRRILSVTEEELTRIVLDIHDGPVQKLFAALNHLLHIRATVERRARAEEANDAADVLPELIRSVELLELSLHEIRTFLGAFQPEALGQRPLLDVLEALVIQHEQLTHSVVNFESSATLPEVSVPVKIALYRILQEALSNAHRHAQAQEVWVRISTRDEWLTMEIIDRGKGFVPPILEGPTATEDRKHIGLRGMRDRLYLVGGRLQVVSAPGEGTMIRVTVPV